jgi:hypothetical protein
MMARALKYLAIKLSGRLKQLARRF